MSNRPSQQVFCIVLYGIIQSIMVCMGEENNLVVEDRTLTQWQRGKQLVDVIQTFLSVLGLVRVLNSVFFSCESPRPAVVGMVTVHTC